MNRKIKLIVKNKDLKLKKLNHKLIDSLIHSFIYIYKFYKFLIDFIYIFILY